MNAVQNQGGKMYKKANAFSIIIWMVSAIVIVFFLAGWLYFHHTLTNALLNVHVDTKAVNFTYAVQHTIVPIDSALSSLTWISFVLIVTLAFSILIENYYIRQHPVLLFVHILIVILGIVGAVYLSNYYDTLKGSQPLADILSTFSASNYIVLLLPIWVGVIGIFGIILLVINLNRDPELSVKGAGI
jgi:hypothetical protein